MDQENEGGLESFLKWATQLGISDSTSPQNPNTPLSCLGQCLCVSSFPHAGGRGLAALRDIKKGELILSVPKSALITSETLLMKDCKLSLAVSTHSSLSSTQILTVCLLYEMGKGKSSQWHPYFLQLPRSYDTLATFGQFEMQALQVDDAIWAAEKARFKAETDWKEAATLMEEVEVKPKLLTFRAWLWASATISSRTMHVPWDDAGCLCPVGDFFNYAAPEEELLGSDDLTAQLQRLTDGGYEDDVAAYCFYAKKNYNIGEQVLLSYGTYTNVELLEHYGFLLNENQNDKVFISLENDIYSSSSWPKDSLYIHQNGKPSFALLSALRIWATPPNQRRSVGHTAYSGSQLSAENEVIVMEWIAKKCHGILKSLPTSIKEDSLLLLTIDKMHDYYSSGKPQYVLSASCPEVCAFLEANDLHNGECGAELFKKTKRAMDKWNLAIQWRRGYKRTLVDCISYCSDIINSFPSQKLNYHEN